MTYESRVDLSRALIDKAGRTFLVADRVGEADRAVGHGGEATLLPAEPRGSILEWRISRPKGGASREGDGP